MKNTLTLPDGSTLSWDGGLEEKLIALAMMGIQYTPTAGELATQTRLEEAKATAKAIPNWATWTQEQWQTYFDTNLGAPEIAKVTNIATARTMIERQNAVLEALVKMIIAMRDQIWPDLPES